MDLNIEVIKKADNSIYGNGNDISLVNLGPIALFSNLKLTTSSGTHLEDISHAHIVSLMYKLITSRKDSDDLSIGFDLSKNRRRDELAQSKNIKGKYHHRITLRDVFGFAEYQEKATYGLGYKLTLTGNKDVAVIDKAAGIADARNKVDHIQWYVPHYTRFFRNKLLCLIKFWVKHPQNSDKLNNLFSWKKWKIKTYGTLKSDLKKAWMFVYGLL